MKSRLLLIALLLLALGGGALWWLSNQAAAAGPAASLVPLLAEENQAGFAQVTVPNAVHFPRDLGPHNDYQIEWWYYTGNLATEDGRPFGFELTFFRRAMTPDAPEAPARLWRTNQIYLAHFAVSDVGAETFYDFERFSRGAAGLAGAQAVPYRVWLEDWFVEEVTPGRVRLLAETDQVTLDLLLTETLPPILHGDGGLSQKGPEPGNASYYYSIVQQQARGTVTVQGDSYAVTGRAWKDHEYSTSALSPGTVGWDWFSLQFPDGSALMVVEGRREDGTPDDFSNGTYIAPDGATQALTLGDWELEVLDRWTSPASGAEYPSRWRVTIPQLELELEGEPLLADQELNVSTSYWEGAVRFSGMQAGQPVDALGYVEMTGYGGSITGLQ
ncbi:MAG: lipocalin-like domain-containing protein [Candidatus Promineifilaceae bacterium]|nr:lipocalin-like domain-containing protein [Candidatus Promineifilaceae bacterium]